jgi:hypothetical protein
LRESCTACHDSSASRDRRRILRDFREARLALPDRCTGPGYRALGTACNRWLCRVRSDAFRDLLLPRLGPLSPDARELDLGSGTGFYLDRRQTPAG